MKTPISYYGWKQLLAKTIIEYFPAHRIYIEPYFGGGAVFRQKEPSAVEVINDVNMNVVNFYQVLKNNFTALYPRIKETLHSRATYKKALLIYNCPWLFATEPVIRAWAFRIVTNQGFANKIGSWWYDRSKRARTIQNKVATFREELTERLRYVQIEENEAHKVIQSRDAEDAFVYADPPYIDTNQGHYKGYTKAAYRRDLEVLAKMKGKFLLSSFPNAILNEFVKNYGRDVKVYDKPRTASNGRTTKTRSRKTELLVANYTLD